MRFYPTVLISACATAVPTVEHTPPPPAEPVAVAPPEPAPLLPWYRSWDADNERARLAKIAEIDALEAEYVDVCGPALPRRITGSPLLRQRTTSWNTSTGIVIELSPQAGSPEVLLADLRCHLVSMQLSPFGMDDCPFDLPGLHIDARGDTTGITLVVTVKDPALVGELQRRLRSQIEETERKHHED